MMRHPRVWMGLLLWLAFGSAQAEWAVNMLPGATEVSRSVFDLHMIIFWICVVIGVVVWTSGSGGGLSALGGNSDEDQIRSLMSEPTALKDHRCEADNKFFSKFPGLADGKKAPVKPNVKVTVNSVDVTGERATVNVTTRAESGREASATVYFRKEGGEWKYCLTDSPEMKKLQQLPGMK